MLILIWINVGTPNTRKYTGIPDSSVAVVLFNRPYNMISRQIKQTGIIDQPPLRKIDLFMINKIF